MKYNGSKVEDIKIAYIGGEARGWAWGFMSDLAAAEDISGNVYLYDIDKKAACNNENIGNMFNYAIERLIINNKKVKMGIDNLRQQWYSNTAVGDKLFI